MLAQEVQGCYHYKTSKIQAKGQREVSMGKGACHQACRPEFQPLNPHDRKRELTSTNRPWASASSAL